MSGTTLNAGSELVNSLAFIDPDHGAAIEYDGPFAFTRDGGCAEVTIPTDPEDDAGIYPGTADRLTDRVGDIGVALADGGVESSGVIEAAELIENRLVVRIDDGSHGDPSAVDVDLSEVDR